MSKKAVNIAGGQVRSQPGAPARGMASPPGTRMAREAHQQRWLWLALFGVVAVVVITLVAGILADYVIGPAQPVATVNGVPIRTDAFKRYQQFERYILQNQSNQITVELQQLQADTKHATQNQALIQQLTQQQQSIGLNASNIQAYTLSQMEQALELRQAAAKIGAAPTPAQLNAAIVKLRQQAGGTVGYNRLLSQTGVSEGDLRAYFASGQVVQQNVITHFSAGVSAMQPEAQARHILVTSKQRADLLAIAIRHGASFAALARKYSIDNGVQPGAALSAQQRLQQQKLSSAFNGGWLRDPSLSFAPDQPTWLSRQTSFVAPVLDAILTMKPSEVRVVKSTFGYHVIQVAAHRVVRLTPKQLQVARQQQGQSKYSTWVQTATDPANNKVSPPSPYTQFPQSTPSQ